MFVDMKHRYACSGSQTIGSPRTLKLVLMITGQPVFCSNALINLLNTARAAPGRPSGRGPSSRRV